MPSHPVNKVLRCVALLLLATATFIQPLRSQTPSGFGTRTILLWNDNAVRDDSLDQQAFEATLQCIGLRPSRVPFDSVSATQMDPGTLLVVPRSAASKIRPGQIRSIVRRLLNGLRLVTDGRSRLSDALGIRLGARMKVSALVDRLRPGLFTGWSDAPAVPWVAGMPGTSAKVLYADKATNHPLGILMQVGKGKCLYLAPLFDPRSGLGYGRFPTLPDAIIKELGRIPELFRKGADAYFDAGYRPEQSPDSIAAVWDRWGIRVVHAAAWYAFDRRGYDYRALIDACHRRGILVYAWLEWPYVGKGFWDAHPEWRQKTALLKDAHFDFLYLMDLENPACMSSALGALDSLLALDWDGTDVAEFTLTGAGKHGLEGPVRPDWFTGFTDYCRAEFKSQEGFDPIELFNRSSPHYWRTDTAGLASFYRYRIRINASTQHTLFTELDRINRQNRKSRELILTIVDNSMHPEFGELLGFDLKQTLDLVQEFDITLQVEDPYMEWTKPPDRYLAVGSYYRRLLSDRPFIIDINVVPMEADRKKDFPTGQPTGTEVFECLRYAATYANRVCFYCESSVAEKDWELMRYAMAADASVSADSAGLRVNASSTVVALMAGENVGFTLDGEPWSAYSESGVIVPTGTHLIRSTATEHHPGEPRLVSITGELLNARSKGRELMVEYSSRPRCLLGFNRPVNHVMIDGGKVTEKILVEGNPRILIAPPGKHSVVVSVLE